MADAAFNAKLFDAAVRHYDAYATFAGGKTPEITQKIRESQAGDIGVLVALSRKDLGKEMFSSSRKIAIEAMKRYPGHEAATSIPPLLEEISKAGEEAGNVASGRVVVE